METPPYDEILFELDSLFADVVFDPSKDLLHESGSLCVVSVPHQKMDSVYRSGVIVQAGPAGLSPVPLLQHLAYGVFDGDQLVRHGRTDDRGHFFVKLPEGNYRIRYATTVFSRAETEVLKAVGDPDAKAILHECFEIGPAGISPFARVSSTPEFSGVGFSSAEESDLGAPVLPDGINVGFSTNGRWFLVDYPAGDEGQSDHPPFKYGCTMIEVVTTEGKIIEQHLVPIFLSDANRYRGYFEISNFVTRFSEHDVRCVDIDDEYLAELDSWASEHRKWLVARVEELICDEVVENDLESLKRLETLMKKIK